MKFTMRIPRNRAVFQALMEMPEPFTSHELGLYARDLWDPAQPVEEVVTYARGRITVMLQEGYLTGEKVPNRTGTASAAQRYRRAGDWSTATFVQAFHEWKKGLASKAVQARRKADAEAAPVWNEETFSGGYEAFRATLKIAAPEIHMAGLERHEL